jgi:sulfur carrier protein
MKINYNGTELEVKNSLTLASFISEMKLESRTIAAAVNEQIVPKKNWNTFILEDGMTVDIFNLVAGG